ncbi:lysine 2,3-aminomutase YodO family protein [Desulfofarcimen acetoxidans DSM 771]|uniref:Lysine 2,3-aminomutase YodO family protein n=1 Tax=Desulfofarcimen acetoxidans (strain ATCC 49208 / DSM 771 / KCTC 5769 / VKM B-1644 / 5575) TaxID=485916 RepID=C8W664_DESAS|nr:glutamate 2,3-aminomutase [Desulfofarcimen acetoxidans]ACV61519.1 lysine 2,3-aminomutase YodO family protein [Desulfofarcimen acetoxidans DSM 771]
MSVYLNENDTFNCEDKRAIGLRRATGLKKSISDYLEKKDKIPTGFDLQQCILSNREKLFRHFNANEEKWRDWHWQISHRINDVELLSSLIQLSEERCAQIRKVGLKFRWSVSPYYASLIVPDSLNDPVMLQSVPSIKELDVSGYADPMAEELTSPAPCITRRYPDRLIINVTNKCAMYCRHCQRRRGIGDVDRHQTHQDLLAALDYIRKNKEIRDVLITGGDALLLSDKKIDWLLSELDSIKHVEIKRLGTRTIVTLPQRITPELCEVLKQHPPVYINTQFNHPQEITPESKLACDMLVSAGVVLGNQAVLLKGINNNPHVMKKLNQELLKIRVRPYYIFHAKQVIGTRHFITSVNEGIEIMEKLRGYTSGLAVPTYIINAPNGYGKIPILPKYLLGIDNSSVRLRNWENRQIDYTVFPEKRDSRNFIKPVY